MTSETIAVKVGHEFAISLKSIASAGYLWKIVSLPNTVQSLGSEVEKNRTGESKPGDSTTQIFRFRALEAGEHIITFALARPWEEKAIETRKRTVTASE
jgi:predicted secreted protein